MSTTDPHGMVVFMELLTERPEPELDRPGGSRAPTTARVRLAELAVVLLILLPSALSFTSAGDEANVGFELTAIATMLRELGLAALVALLVWRGSEPLAELGWRLRRPVREMAIGLAAFPATFLFVTWVGGVLQSLGVPGPAQAATFLQPQPTVAQLALAAIMIGVVAFAAETVFRGYLMLRFGQVTGNGAVAVLASSAVFALGHGYEGLSGAISAGVFGAVMALLYRWRASLVAPMTVHFLQDFTAIVVFTVLRAAS